MSQAELPLLAWRVEVNYMGSIVFAATAAKARWQAVKSYWDAGYGRGPGTWPPGVFVRREERYDRRATDCGKPGCYNESYL